MPKGILETLDTIRRLRAEAEEEWQKCGYDPEGFVQSLCDAKNKAADHMEQILEHAIGWSRHDHGARIEEVENTLEESTQALHEKV